MENKIAIEIKNLHFSYPDGNCVLRGINLKIYEKEKVGIVGENGAGKTTLLLHLNGILKGEGEIKIFGKNIEKKNLREIRKIVGIVFQNPDDQLFTTNVFDDVAFGPLNLGLTKDEVKKRVKEALSIVELEGFEHRSPWHLSLGEKKRAAIATILSMEPEIIAMDEPTANLSPKIRRKLIDLLKKLNKTIVIASHDIEMVKEVCTRILYIENGLISDDAIF
uniref:ABC transporter ATP-binding protein n=1 Tax=candidate division WOR-3 bacterium TaxID=2052148 RepID=A0A7C4UA20_UNCW3